MAATKFAHVLDEFRGSFAWLLPISIFTTAVVRHLSFSVSKNARASASASSRRRGAEKNYEHQSRVCRESDDLGGDSEAWPEKIGGGPSAEIAHRNEKLKRNDSEDPWDFKPAEPTVKQNNLPSPLLAIPPTSPTQSSPKSLMDLPPEIRISIFSHCAPNPSARFGPHSMDTFLTLLRVSKTIQRETYIACLPLTPLALWSKKGVKSFRELLHKNEDLRCLVRYLWIGTGKLDEEELRWAVDVVGLVTQIKSIACGEHLLAESVNKGVLAPTCETVTLMSVERDMEYYAKGVRQVRLCTGVYSTQERFPDLETLCFNARRMNVKDERVKVEYEAVDKWIECVKRFVLVERDLKRVSGRGLEIKFKVVGRKERSDMFSVTLPARWTEWDIWSAEAIGMGVWDVCGL